MKKEKQGITTNEEAEVEVIKKPSKASRIISTVINVVLVIAIILAAISTYISFVSSSGNGVPSVFGLQIYSIQTESMYPILKPGDLIFDTAVKDPADLEVGDIITYWTVINGERVLNTHKIYEIYDGGDYRIFSTKGEANNVVDSLTVHESEVVGKYKFRVGGLGKVFDYLQDSTGFLIVVVIPVFIFFLFYLVQFFRVLFEYQNVKNRLKYEQERGRTEDMLADQEKKLQESKEEERQKIEAELREKLKAELLMSMAAEKEAAEADAKEESTEETSAEEAPEEEAPEEEASEEEAPAESENKETEEEKSEESETEEASDEKSEESDK